ncbi:SET domain-containing protein [Phlegmacium glaucopus]|nr:SET domain-containing protein [Phlegmacium glaucopus]
MIGHEAQINLDEPVTSSRASTTTSASASVHNEHISVSPPIPGPSRRSSRSSTNERLEAAFDNDFGPFDAVPATRTPTPEDQEPSASLSPPGSPKTYGGFRALTWKNFRKDLNNFTPKSYYAKDLPHSLQDHINSMSDYTQKMGGMRDLFKATILENTVEDEPNAPPIEVGNNVDSEATPPWEFYYTNQMWLGEGVPPPDIKSLVSCTCKGGCNPKSKTCACLLRQREVVGDPLLEFAYDKNGKLKIPGYPIFECNDLCGCSDECRNRVVQHGRKVSVDIAKTEAKGWGVFAGHKKIPEGTFIGIYSGELLTDAVAHERGVKYNKFGRTYLFDIDFHHLKEGNREWVNYFTVDAYHAGNFSRFLNHSCDPNCRLYACYINEGNIQKPLLAIFSRKDIEPYQEICFNYQGSYPDNDDDDDSDDDHDLDPDHGKDIVYVPCRCGAKNCTGKF